VSGASGALHAGADSSHGLGGGLGAGLGGGLGGLLGSGLGQRDGDGGTIGSGGLSSLNPVHAQFGLGTGEAGAS